MDYRVARERITGNYVAIPTMFKDGDLDLNLPAMRRHVRFLLNGGLKSGNGVLLVCGAAGDFPSLSVEERLAVAEAVIDEAGGRIGIILGGQSSDTREAVALARGAVKLGCVAVQVSAPFYYPPTEGDVQEYVQTIADTGIGIILYPTWWHNFKMSLDFISRLTELPQVIGLKWSAQVLHDYELGLHRFHDRLCVIDNNGTHVLNHMLGGRGLNTHPTNFWPQWGVKVWEHMNAGRYTEAQAELTRVYTPWSDLMADVCNYTGGEGHLDQLCLEAVGLDSSRSRPPIRDVRPRFLEKVKQYVKQVGAPRATV